MGIWEENIQIERKIAKSVFLQWLEDSDELGLDQ